MRKSLELRYRMLPTHYSWSHAMFDGGVPAMRPLLMEYPADAAVGELTSEWLLGDAILAAPVLKEDNSSAPYLPAGTWYEFNSTTSHQGPTTVSLSAVPLDHIPVYVKAGGIVALAPLVQYTDALPGDGPLELHVYAGADGAFTLVEDDGETYGYRTDPATAKVRGPARPHLCLSPRCSLTARRLPAARDGLHVGRREEDAQLECERRVQHQGVRTGRGRALRFVDQDRTDQGARHLRLRLLLS